MLIKSRTESARVFIINYFLFNQFATVQEAENPLRKWSHITGNLRKGPAGEIQLQVIVLMIKRLKIVNASTRKGLQFNCDIRKSKDYLLAAGMT